MYMGLVQGFFAYDNRLAEALAFGEDIVGADLNTIIATLKVDYGFN